MEKLKYQIESKQSPDAIITIYNLFVEYIEFVNSFVYIDNYELVNKKLK